MAEVQDEEEEVYYYVEELLSVSPTVVTTVVVDRDGEEEGEEEGRSVIAFQGEEVRLECREDGKSGEEMFLTGRRSDALFLSLMLFGELDSLK